MGFAEILTLIFVVMKIIGVIEWSWWLVLLPEIIAAVIYVVIIAVYIFCTIRAEREIKRINEKYWKL